MAENQTVLRHSGVLGRVEVITGGFPCQDVSDAGERTGLEGERSGLWWEMLRAVCMVRPKYVVVENVAGLLNRGMGEVLGSLAHVGFDSEWDSVSACSLGAPHTRERVLIIAYPTGQRPIPDGMEDGRNSTLGMVETPIWSTDWLQPEMDNSPLLAEEWGPQTEGGTQPCFVRVADGLPDELDSRRKALGNAVVPQIAEWIGRRIIEAEENK